MLAFGCVWVHIVGMTIKELQEKIKVFQDALTENARMGNNKVFAEVAQTSLIELQSKLIAKLAQDARYLIKGLKAEVETAKKDTESFREAFEEVGHGSCDFCDGPMFAEESHATLEGEEMCDGCYESALCDR